MESLVALLSLKYFENEFILFFFCLNKFLSLLVLKMKFSVLTIKNYSVGICHASRWRQSKIKSGLVLLSICRLFKLSFNSFMRRIKQSNIVLKHVEKFFLYAITLESLFTFGENLHTYSKLTWMMAFTVCMRNGQLLLSVPSNLSQGDKTKG